MTKNDTEDAAVLSADVGTDVPTAVDVGPDEAPLNTYIVGARAKNGVLVASIHADTVRDAFDKLGKLRDNKLEGYSSAQLRQEGASDLVIIDTKDGIAWYTEPFTYIV